MRDIQRVVFFINFSHNVCNILGQNYVVFRRYERKSGELYQHFLCNIISSVFCNGIAIGCLLVYNIFIQITKQARRVVREPPCLRFSSTECMGTIKVCDVLVTVCIYFTSIL